MLLLLAHIPVHVLVLWPGVVTVHSQKSGSQEVRHRPSCQGRSPGPPSLSRASRGVNSFLLRGLTFHVQRVLKTVKATVSLARYYTVS